jgi:pimeloyl-ACP methyl ester carboxylesterase
MTVTIFIHGLESSNQGTKSVFFREKYPHMIIPHFTGGLEARMEKLERELSGKTAIRLVGSSFGGLMASIFAMRNEKRVDKMVLLAPAINLVHFAGYRRKQVSVPVRVFHGTNDKVIPFEEVEAVARELFTDLSFHAVDDDHFLHKTFKTIDWDDILL